MRCASLLHPNPCWLLWERPCPASHASIVSLACQTGAPLDGDVASPLGLWGWGSPDYGGRAEPVLWCLFVGWVGGGRSCEITRLSTSVHSILFLEQGIKHSRGIGF